jgi:integrase
VAARNANHPRATTTAEDLLNRRIVETQDGRVPTQVRQRRQSVNQLLDALGVHFKTHTRSYKNFEATVKPVRKFMGDRPAASIDTPDLDRFILAMGERYSKETIGSQLRRLRQAYRHQRAIACPVFPKMPSGQARDHLITLNDQKLLLAAFGDTVFGDIAAFCFSTGWRVSECLSLTWDSVMPDAGVIRLRQEHSKTKRARNFPLHGRVQQIIERRAGVRHELVPFVFHHRLKPVPYSTMRDNWTKAAVKAGLGEFDHKAKYTGPNVHDCRRAFVSGMLASGVQPMTAMRLSGHRTMSMLDRYNIDQTEVLTRAVEDHERYLASRESGKVISLVDRLSDVRIASEPLRKANGE